MRTRVMVATGAALVAMAGTAAAAHATTGRPPVPAAKAPAVAVSTTSDDRGRHVEPGDDHDRGRGGDDGPGHH